MPKYRITKDKENCYSLEVKYHLFPFWLPYLIDGGKRFTEEYFAFDYYYSKLVDRPHKTKYDANKFSIEYLQRDVARIDFEKNNPPKYKVGQKLGKATVVKIEILGGFCHNAGVRDSFEYKYIIK